MIKITKEQARKRWDELPEILKEALFSDTNTDAVWQIGKEHHLPEDKISILALNVGDVILGFLSLEELSKKISESLNIDSRIGTNISQEIEKKVFASISEEVRKNYNPELPSVEVKANNGQKISLEKLSEEKILPVESFGESKTTAPLIIHEENKLPPDFQRERPSSGGFSLPFRFFKPKPFRFFKPRAVREESTFLRAEIEAPNEISKSEFLIPKEKEGGSKRVVHYSEYRSPITPLPDKEEIIDLEKLSTNYDHDYDNNKNDTMTNNNDEIDNDDEKNIDSDLKKLNNVKLEGNIVDLRKP